MNRKIYKNEKEGKLFGVCAGISDMLNIDVTIVRCLIFALSFVISGLPIVYLILGMVLPDKKDVPAEQRLYHPLMSGNYQLNLHLSRHDSKIFGVCGGIAERFNVDPSIVRAVFIASVFFNGLGLFLYAFLAIILEKGPEQLPYHHS